MKSSSFRLSRIYAEGWNKAQVMSVDEVAALTIADFSALNPYGAEPERSRWLKGFTTAIEG